MPWVEWINNLRGWGVPDWASVLSLIVSCIGFTITIIGVWRSKSAATRAAEAADKAVESIRGVETIEMLSKAISFLEEIYRSNNTKAWEVILDRHVAFRSHLTATKSGPTIWKDEHLAVLQGAIQHSKTLANKIQIALEKNEKPTGIALMNKILADQMQNLNELLAEIRSEVGG